MIPTQCAGVSLVAFLSVYLCRTYAIASSISKSPVPGEVFQLTDLNFDQVINGTHPWFIDIYAPWCPACQELEPAWIQVAAELKNDGILVGKVDGTKERSLLMRFGMQHYPSLFHIHGIETREYNGPRATKNLVDFARGVWRGERPRTGCSSPVSRCGRVFGEIMKLPLRLKATYVELREKKKYSDITLMSGFLAVPVVLGLLFIAALDFYYSRQQIIQQPHQHYD